MPISVTGIRPTTAPKNWTLGTLTRWGQSFDGLYVVGFNKEALRSHRKIQRTVPRFALDEVRTDLLKL